MINKFLLAVPLVAAIFSASCTGAKGEKAGVRADENSAMMQNSAISLRWEKRDGVWKLRSFAAKDGASFSDFGAALGEYSLIYAAEVLPDAPKSGKPPYSDFLGEKFKHMGDKWAKANTAVRLNTAGDCEFFFPTDARREGDALVFTSRTSLGKYSARWELCKKFPSDLIVTLEFTAAQEGYYSLPTPTISTISEGELAWGIVPGWYQGDFINKSFHLAYGYAQGLPNLPVVCNENTVTTMSSIIENKRGLALAVTPAPGQDRNPYEKDAVTHEKLWKVGLSHMSRRGALSPSAYHPVLGQEGSFMQKGGTRTFEFRVTLEKNGWYGVYKHAIYDVYDLQKSLDLKDTKESLTQRVIKMHKYLTNDETSMWRVEEFEGMQIGAQRYLGGVVGADKKQKDAMKNSDIGAAYMLAAMTADPVLKEKRLPYMRNFKVAQQDKKPGFAQGAALGQYFLAIKKEFTEEWDSSYEPVGLTYYTMMDIGNILLFTPDDEELKTLLRAGAERLLAWQKPGGGWEVAYDKQTHEPLYQDLKDYHPTFYGLVIAHRVLGDEKYLAAAKRGADWIIANSVEKASFLGVCGDVRFINDFATAQIAQALLDLYEITKERKYLDAAVKTARMYTTSVYTHPVPTRELKQIKSRADESVMKEVYDWQLSQVGLSFEHGGCMGSATFRGPILLLSHGAMFVKLYELTGDRLFLDLARAGALGRDAFVNPDCHVASYYWLRFDRGPGTFPHHAWWQVGWIFDYLVAEAEMRSGGKIKFPRGFITPKVGPQRALGFAPGEIGGVRANLILRDGLVSIDNPNVNYLTALSTDGKKLFVILMNDQARENEISVKLDLSKISWKGARERKLKMEPFGFRLLDLSQSL